jgi:hypothetical protein
MKTKEEIEKLAWKFYVDKDGIVPNTYEREGFTNGYTQCQEDMANEMENCMRFFLKHTQKQITEKIAKESPNDFDVAKEVVKFYIQSLNKQD